ncbi:MAG: hypothetical protein H7Y11_05195 [Armatimonadetes bacterium]|nr:hypothetical protein [Anaerolineae bacterium]
MNALQTRFDQRRLMLIVGSVIAIVFALLLSRGVLSSQSGDSMARYLPAYYGLPDTIAGYKVLAVMTSENTECIGIPGQQRLVIQVTEPDLDHYLSGDTYDVLQKAVAALGNSSTTIMITGPGADFETLVSENERWNQVRKQNGCFKLGGPIIIGTETTGKE